MQYQLVLQFPFLGLLEYDALIELERVLEEKLDDWADVDGHDAGVSEVNIYVLTDTPKETFLQCKDIITEMGLINRLSAAYRLTDEEGYIRLWPENSKETFKVL